MRDSAASPVFLVETSTGHGGSARSLAGILSRLDRARFSPTVVFYSNAGDLASVDRLGVEILRIRRRVTVEASSRMRGAPLFVRRFRMAAFLAQEVFPGVRAFAEIIAARRPRLVHVNNEILSGLPAIIAARKHRVPVLCHLRATRRLTRTERLAARWVDQFVATSVAGVDCYAGEGIPRARLRLIYNGIDKALYDPARVNPERVRRELGLPAGVPVIGVVARIARVKGQQEFLEAAAQVLERGAVAHFVLVGDAAPEEREYERGLHDYVAAKNIDRHVTFTGWRDDIPDITAALDVVVQPTAYWEGFCNAAVEGMMLEKPVIGTTAGALGETLGDTQTAVALSSNDPSGLADAILDILVDPDRSRAMARRGRERAEQLFSLDSTVQAIEAAYTDLLSRANGDQSGRLPSKSSGGLSGGPASRELMKGTPQR